MIEMNDIDYKINSRIFENNFWELNILEKKSLIDSELKNYIISKLQELNLDKVIPTNINQELTVTELLQFLANNISQDQRFGSIDCFIHYIINMAGILQGWVIDWMIEEDDDLIKLPLIKFDENERWTSLTTHRETDYVATFNFVYETFKNSFMIKGSTKKLEKIIPKNEK